MSDEYDRPLRIAFLHPDLGIGGAERLIVDAAVGLQTLGHNVEIFTSYHDPARSFSETNDGTLRIHVLGDVFPRSLGGRFIALCAMIRQFHLVVGLLWSFLLYKLQHFPIIGSFPQPPPRGTVYTPAGAWSVRRYTRPYDVFLVDQLSTAIPLLRWGSRTRVVFYCHFPDLLLSPGRLSGPAGRQSALRAAYRGPLDKVEEVTTGQADKILVNSEFTADIFRQTFGSLGRIPRVVYPGINVKTYQVQPKRFSTPRAQERKEIDAVDGFEPTFLSINRFERKKEVRLAMEAFAAQKRREGVRLVIAGGYDPRLKDNVVTLRSLQDLADSLSLTHHTYSPQSALETDRKPSISSSPSPKSVDVLFIPNLTTAQKLHLLNSPSTLALLYTPSNEHFGIVPLEAMAAGLPVLAPDNGGPLETVVSASDTDLTSTSEAPEGNYTGLLRTPDVPSWTTAIERLLSLPAPVRGLIRRNARSRVESKFSLEAMASSIETALRDAIDAEGRQDIWMEQDLWTSIAVVVGVILMVTALGMAVTLQERGKGTFARGLSGEGELAGLRKLRAQALLRARRKAQAQVAQVGSGREG